MICATISLATIENINKFYHIVCHKEYDVDVARGRHCVDAKSVMGIYSFDLSKPVEVQLHCEKDEYDKTIDEIASVGIPVLERV